MGYRSISRGDSPDRKNTHECHISGETFSPAHCRFFHFPFCFRLRIGTVHVGQTGSSVGCIFFEYLGYTISRVLVLLRETNFLLVSPSFYAVFSSSYFFLGNTGCDTYLLYPWTDVYCTLFGFGVRIYFWKIEAQILRNRDAYYGIG